MIILFIVTQHSESIDKNHIWEYKIILWLFKCNFLRVFNSHGTSGEKCVEIVKTLHVKFFPFGSVEPVGSVTVNIHVMLLLKSCPSLKTNLEALTLQMVTWC